MRWTVSAMGQSYQTLASDGNQACDPWTGEPYSPCTEFPQPSSRPANVIQVGAPRCVRGGRARGEQRRIHRDVYRVPVVLKLRRAGVSFRAIAEATGWGIASVKRYAQQAGITSRVTRVPQAVDKSISLDREDGNVYGDGILTREVPDAQVPIPDSPVRCHRGRVPRPGVVNQPRPRPARRALAGGSYPHCGGRGRSIAYSDANFPPCCDAYSPPCPNCHSPPDCDAHPGARACPDALSGVP